MKKNEIACDFFCKCRHYNIFFAITSVKIPDRLFYSTFTCLTVTMTSWNCDVIDMFRILAVGMLCLHVTFVTVVLIRHQTFEAW